MAVVLMSTLVLALAACQQQEGAAEQLKDATDKLGQQLEKAREKMQDAIRDNDK